MNWFGAGTVFAYPLVPFTCLSGTVDPGGTIEFRGKTITIDPAASYSESAQRLFPVPTDQGGVGVIASSRDNPATLQAGAAMTALHLEGEDSNGKRYRFDLLADDHFLLNPQPTDQGVVVEDTEDFLIVGSRGTHRVRGRLTGRGRIISEQPLGIDFEISGTVCIR